MSSSPTPPPSASPPPALMCIECEERPQLTAVSCSLCRRGAHTCKRFSGRCGECCWSVTVDNGDAFVTHRLCKERYAEYEEALESDFLNDFFPFEEWSRLMEMRGAIERCSAAAEAEVEAVNRAASRKRSSAENSEEEGGRASEDSGKKHRT